MSLSTILNGAATALSVNQQALRTTATNIANVNTPGYVRQRVHLETAVAGNQTAGVQIAGIERAVDRFLEAASWSAKADFAQYDALSDYYGRFETLLGNPNDNTSIPGKLDILFSDLSSLSLDPTAAGARQNALASINSFGNSISYMAEQIQNLRSEVSGQISEAVGEINSAIRRIADLNPRIVAQNATSTDVGGLEELRSQAISDLSKLIDIQVNQEPDGSVRVTTSTGVSLVGVTSHELQYTLPGTITSGTKFDPITLHAVDKLTGIPSPTGSAFDNAIVSGELRGLLTMRDEVLPDFATELGELGGMAVDRFNAIHNTNTAAPPPNTLTGIQTGMLATDAHGFTGQAHFAVVDETGLEVNRVTIDFDGYAPGTPLSTVIADVNAGLGGDATMSLVNGVMTLTATNPANGVAIVQDPTLPSDRGGRGFSHFFGMNNLMTSNIPSHFDSGFVGTDAHGFTAGQTMNIELRGPGGQSSTSYTLTIAGADFDDLITDLNASPIGAFATFGLDANGTLTTTYAPGYEGYKLFTTADTTSRGGTSVSLSRLFGIGETYTANAAHDIAVTSNIASNNQSLALGQYDLTAAVGDPVVTTGDSRGGLDLAELENTALQFDQAGKLNGMRATLGQYSAAFLSNAALSASTADGRMKDTQTLSVEIDEKLSNATGVNLDEELSNLLVYQNAYNAAARIITTAQEMMDTLIRMMN